MRKIFIILFLIQSVTPSLLFGQANTFPSSGNVGIRITSPSVPLHVNGDVLFERQDNGGRNHLLIHSNSGGVFLTSDDPGVNQKDLFIRASPTGNGQTNRSIRFQTGKNSNGDFMNRMIIGGNGNVGIGIINPTTALHVKGTIAAEGMFYIRSDDGNSAGYIGTTGESESLNGVRINSSRGGGKIVFNTIGGSSSEKMRITNVGNVGIGTTLPTHKLEVNGAIRAKEVKLEATNWPDYVFEKDYQLMPLEAVDTFIVEYGHLPGLKPAKVYEEEGVNMLEINQKLLEKIEELTLYLIEEKRQREKLEYELIFIKEKILFNN
ncbi:tail fiber protein [Belliella sp. DSM 111904]|uniref:Tail fiber protein n=1 Tax=Belliella filtrata TaxID=2923435 RepID=A0ABS9UX23_9BACT|nr:tail fiber protein [Belliella filtrata]MCH7408717.1 tail fiber protein [Belliella filtrata]